jgi:hypothetical protein
LAQLIRIHDILHERQRHHARHFGQDEDRGGGGESNDEDEMGGLFSDDQPETLESRSHVVDPAFAPADAFFVFTSNVRSLLLSTLQAHFKAFVFASQPPSSLG